MSDYKNYVAYYLTGQWHNPITSVLADSPEMARQRLEAELKKAGRRDYLRLWERDGRLVKAPPAVPEASDELSKTGVPDEDT